MMLAEGVTEPCGSEWAFPIVVVRKKENTIRLCVDYRRLNAETLIPCHGSMKSWTIWDRPSICPLSTKLAS